MKKCLCFALVILLCLPGCKVAPPSINKNSNGENDSIETILIEAPWSETGGSYETMSEAQSSMDCTHEMSTGTTESAPSESIKLEINKQSKTEPDAHSTVTGDNNESNPYDGDRETPFYWRYDLFEIFRGADVVDFDDTLNCFMEYSCMIIHEEEDWPDTLHEYKSSITLPQASGSEIWAGPINKYYQSIFPDLITESDATWREYYDDWYVQELSYYFEGAYIVDNVLNVARSRNFCAWRPSDGWDPFADMFSVLDGRKLNLDDLFCVDRDEFLPELRATYCYWDAYAASFYEDCPSEYRIDFFDEASVAVAPVGLVFIFPTGVADCMAAGTVFLYVPFKTICGILNPVYFPNYPSKQHGVPD